MHSKSYGQISSSLGTAEVEKIVTDLLAKDQASLVLASLPADTWTDFPTSTANLGRAIAGFQFRTAGGESILLDTQLVGSTWQVKSGIAITNLQILVEY